MNIYIAAFPDRTIIPNKCQEVYVTAIDKRYAWDKVHRENPFEKIVILDIDMDKK